MFHTVKSYSQQGGVRSNEDIFGSGAGFAFVIDGATSLSSPQDPSNGYFFVKEVAASLEKLLPDLSQSLQDCLRKAIKNTDNSSCEGASASVVLLRQKNQDSIEFLSLGDCVLLEKQGDIILKFFDDSVSKLDNRVIDKMVSLAKEKNVSPKEVREEEVIKEMLLAHRQLKNTPEGYWILDQSGVGIDQARLGSRAVVSGTEFLLMSDGFHIAFDFGLFSTPEEAFARCQGETLETLVALLREQEVADGQYIGIPRLKQSDDATVLFARL